MTKTLMSASAAGLALLGFGLLFTPDALGHAMGLDLGSDAAGQLVGTAALGFASLNWLGRGAVYGGIYGRPIVVANFVYAFVTAMVLIRRQLDSGGTTLGWLLALFYLGYGVGFTVLMTTGPRSDGGRGGGT